MDKLEECPVPEWYKKQFDADGWKVCPADEECSHCGRLTQLPLSPCCAEHNFERKLLALDDDGNVYYPHPDKEALEDRLELVDAQLLELLRAVHAMPTSTLLKIAKEVASTLGIKDEDMQECCPRCGRVPKMFMQPYECACGGWDSYEAWKLAVTGS